MMATLLHYSILYVFICVLLAMLFCAFRLVAGPSAHDRVLALVLGIRYASDVYFEAAMLIALLGFVSTIAVAKFLMRGEVIE